MNMLNLNHNEYGSNHVIMNPKNLNHAKCVPDNNHRFNSVSGNVLMYKKSLFGNKYYITKRPVNALIYAISRSGYYQMIVKPTIDINSRSQFQPNMVIDDVNGRTYYEMSSILRERGYNVIALNLSTQKIPSIHYNPLDLVTKLAYQGDIAGAESVCTQIAYNIYNPKGQGQNSFFFTSAANLFNAVVFAQLAFNYNNSHNFLALNKQHNKPVTIRNTMNLVNELGSNFGSKQHISKLINYFSKLQQRMTKLNHNKKHLETEQKNYLTLLTPAINNFKNAGLTNNKIAGSVYATFLDRLKIYQLPEIDEITDKTTHVFKNHLNQPVALFIINSGVQTEINQLATLLIVQITDILATNALKFRNYLKFSRETQFILNGIGSLPPIYDLAKNLSIAPTIHINYLLRFQNYEQIQYIYGNNQAHEIVANCPLIYYVLSQSDETIKMISDALGKRTVTTTFQSPNGKIKTKQITKPIMSTKQLKYIKKGEAIILRIPTGKSTASLPPIFDAGRYTLPLK